MKRTAFPKHRLALLWLAVLGLVALSAPWLAPLNHPSPPWLWTQWVHGTRTTLTVAALGLTMALFAGTVLGWLASQLRGLWDSVLARLIETFSAFPALVLLALVRSLSPRPSLWLFALALATLRFGETARLVRMQVLQLRSADFYLAARALGASRVRLLLWHLGPHLLASIAHSAVFGLGVLVLVESSMSFVGLGAWGPLASWGVLLDGALHSAHPTLALIPLVAILLTVSSLYSLADWLHERLAKHRFFNAPCVPPG